MRTEALTVSVVMQRLPTGNRWIPFQWRAMEVVPAAAIPSPQSHCLRSDENDLRWLFPDYEVRLYSDEAEGYFLNISSPKPCWFVMWRLEERDGVQLAVPKSVTLSYNEAARLMDGGEQVETLDAGADVIAWLTAFVEEFYKPEQKRKRKKPSFEGGAEVDSMARQEGNTRGS